MTVRGAVLEVETPLAVVTIGVLRERLTPGVVTVQETPEEVEGVKSLLPKYSAVS